MARRQLLEAGLSYDVIRRLVARRWLLEVLPGVFAGGYRPQAVPLARETAAVLSVTPPAWLSHHSAAAAWGLTCLADEPRPVDVTVTGAGAPQRIGVRVHRSRGLTREHQRINSGLPVVSPARMLLEISAEVTDRELERAVEHVLVHRLARESDLRTTLDRANGHRGRKRLQSLLDTHSGTTLTRSEAEERMLTLIRGSGLPQPLLNHRLEGFEVDFYWPQAQLVLEVDGFRYHATRTAFERDRRRDTILGARGISSMRVTWRQLDEEPLAVVALLAQTLALAGNEKAPAALSVHQRPPP